MSELERLREDIQEQLDGIKVQWSAVERETNAKARAHMKAGVFASMENVGRMMQEYFQKVDNC